MIWSYLKIALRNLLRSKLYALINITGLSVAIALCVVAYVNYQFSESFDSFHENGDQIYRIKSRVQEKDRVRNWAYVPAPISDLVALEVPGIVRSTRFGFDSGVLRYGDKVFTESLAYANESFFQMFSFPFVLGSEDVLKSKNAIVISRAIAKKYFGDENPIDKRMILSFDGEESFGVVVEAVIENIPMNSSFQFDVLLPYSRAKDLRDLDFEDWGRWASAALIQVDEQADVAGIERQLQSYIQRQNEANEEYPIREFYLDALHNLAKTSDALVGDSLQEGLPIPAIVGPSVAALLVLLMACFNFVNTALAYSSRRLKEIGIRKVVGSVRKQLIAQFLGENLVLCFFALLAGIGLSEIFVPIYDSLWPNISLSINLTENLGLLVFLIGMLLFTALAAGAYPAFYVSSYNPVSIFRGKQQLGGRRGIIRSLLTLQFALSMVGIIGSLVMNKNAAFIENLNLGFAKEQVAVVRVRGESQYDIFKNAVNSDPKIVEVGASRNRVGWSWFTSDIEVDSKAARVKRLEVGENYLQAVGLDLIAGREFDEQLQSDLTEAAIINETFARQFAWRDPLDKRFKMNDQEYRVIGVIRDFYDNGVWRKISPVFLKHANPDGINYASVKFETASIRETLMFLEATWKQLFPNLPSNIRFQEEVMAEALLVTNSIRTVSLYVSILAILISATGLFALVSLTIAKRTKEIGIRKVLGASVTNIVRLMSKEFTLLLVVATVVAAATGYFMMDSLLKSIYAYYVNFGLSPFTAASILVIVVSLLTVASQVYRVGITNPVRALRDE